MFPLVADCRGWGCSLPPAHLSIWPHWQLGDILPLSPYSTLANLQSGVNIFDSPDGNWMQEKGANCERMKEKKVVKRKQWHGGDASLVQSASWRYSSILLKINYHSLWWFQCLYNDFSFFIWFVLLLMNFSKAAWGQFVTHVLQVPIPAD